MNLHSRIHQEFTANLQTAAATIAQASGLPASEIQVSAHPGDISPTIGRALQAFVRVPDNNEYLELCNWNAAVSTVAHSLGSPAMKDELQRSKILSAHQPYVVLTYSGSALLQAGYGTRRSDASLWMRRLAFHEAFHCHQMRNGQYASDPVLAEGLAELATRGFYMASSDGSVPLSTVPPTSSKIVHDEDLAFRARSSEIALDEGHRWLTARVGGTPTVEEMLFELGSIDISRAIADEVHRRLRSIGLASRSCKPELIPQVLAAARRMGYSLTKTSAR